MKTWTITLTAEDEATAQKYLESLARTFQFAASWGAPLDHVYEADNDEKNKLICICDTKTISSTPKTDGNHN